MSNSNEQEKNLEQASLKELSIYFINNLQKIVGEFKEVSATPKLIRFNLFLLKKRVNSLEDKFTLELRKRNFEHTEDMETYKAWCVVDDVRASIESVDDYRSPADMVDAITQIINNFQNKNN
jgi:hypothetical protein